jgi:CrcB protein
VNILAVALGGAFGTVLRYLIILLTTKVIGALPFWAILAINLIGCFLMGMVSLLVMPRTEWPEPIRLGIATGILGGFTTFSSFSFDAGRLINDGVYGLATFYIVASVAGGIVAFFVGQSLARQF